MNKWYDNLELFLKSTKVVVLHHIMNTYMKSTM